MAFLMGVCAVTRMPSTSVFPLASLTSLPPLSTGKSVLLTKPSSLSPVIALPDLSSVRPDWPGGTPQEDGHIAFRRQTPSPAPSHRRPSKEHPRDLLDALRVAVDARVICLMMSRTA